MSRPPKEGGGTEDEEAKAGEKETLSFEFPAGPAMPKPEKDVANAAKKHKRTKAKASARKTNDKRDDKGGPSGGSGVRTPTGG